MELQARLLPRTGIGPVVVLGGCFLTGGLAGSLLAALLSGESVGQLGAYLRDYMDLVLDVGMTRCVLSSAWHHGRWILLCVLLGFSGLGVLCLPVLFVLRGFLLSFGISCFFRFFGTAGLVPAVCLFGLPAILWAPGLFRIGARGLHRSVVRLRQGRSEPLSPPAREGASLAGLVCWLLFFLCVLYEWGALPVLLPLAARILR